MRCRYLTTLSCMMICYMSCGAHISNTKAGLLIFTSTPQYHYKRGLGYVWLINSLDILGLQFYQPQPLIRD